MARLLALEWDTREARVAIATLRGGAVVVDDVFGVELAGGQEQQPVSPQRAGEKIAAALAARGLRRGDALVAIGRASIELKQLSVPPAPDDELPSMVRFQASREFHSIGEDWPVDFAALSGDPTQPRNVLAATVSPQIVEQIRETCAAASLQPTRLVLRPFALASLFRRAQPVAEESVRLLVDPVGEEVDLTAMVDEHVVFLRTARLPGAASLGDDAERPLLAEIRRTMAAVQNQLAGRRVETVYVCGTGNEHERLIARIAADFLGIAARPFDATSVVALAPRLAVEPPQQLARFAPLLGMLLDEAEQAPHAIDFLHPKRAPEPPSRRNAYMLAGAAALVLVAALGAWIWWSLAALDRQIAELAKQSLDMNPAVEQAAEVEQAVATIDQWLRSDITWLDELRELSVEMPPSRDAMLTQLRMVAQPSGGRMELEGLVREAGVVDALEDRLRDAEHTLEGQGRQQDRSLPSYAWSFKSSVLVEPRTAAQYAASAAEPADDHPAAAEEPNERPSEPSPPGDQVQRPTSTEAR